jgi:hypothetical protein
MIEFDKVWNPVHLHPTNRPAFIQVRLDFENLRVRRNNSSMAKKTLVHGRNPRVLGPVRKRMTESAVDLLYPGMDPVAEGNGLQKSDVPAREDIVEVEHDRHRHGDYAEPEGPPE